MGIISRSEALRMAELAGQDLVEVASKADPPVCRIMNYGKYYYEQTKKKNKKTKTVEVKEIKIRPVIEDNDYRVKIAMAQRFLAQGNKVKITLRFRGRELSHHEIGTRLLERLKLDLAACSVVEQEAKLEGRQIMMLLSPQRAAD